MKTTLTLFVTLNYFFFFGQTWSSEVAEIFYEKCAKCHHNGGGAPFPLMTHEDVSIVASSIYDPVYQEKMPPWPPDDAIHPLNFYMIERQIAQKKQQF